MGRLTALSILLTAMLLPGPARAGEAERFFPREQLMKIGVYYYPEQWPREQWARDFRNMAALGFEFTHMGEFAWSFLEPAEGRFDFSWLEEAVALAAKAGLKVILCTPTPCPPAWLGVQHPEIYLVDASGRRQEHGTRGNASLASDLFLARSDRIVTELARRFGRDSRVWGWQLDNEPPAQPDYSPAARVRFQAWLKARYGTIEALNAAWGGSFWSFRYDSFDQVLIPNETRQGEDETSPHAVLDFRRFTADLQAEFLHRQYDILRRHILPGQWVTTNYTNVTDSADPRRSGRLDFISFTMYPVRGQREPGELGFRLGAPMRLAQACDYYRPIRGATGVMELQPGQVNWAKVNPQPQPGAIRMWLWHAFGGGCSFVCTYRYRHPLYGSELYHDGIVGTDGVTPSRGGREFAQAASEIKQLRPLFDPKAKLPERLAARRTAFLWSHDVLWDIENHKQTALWSTWEHRGKYYAAIKSTGAPVDFIAEGDDFSAYPFLVAPAYQLVDGELVRRWREYAERGGHLVLTCRTGQKDRNGRLWEEKWAGPILPLIGAQIELYDLLPEWETGLVEGAGGSHAWNSWGEVLLPDPGTDTLARHARHFYAGKAAAVFRRLGRGSVTYIGVDTLDGRLERELVAEVYRRAGVAIDDYPPGVYVEWRDGFFVAVNYSSQPASIPMPPASRVILGTTPLIPAEVLVWRE